MCIFELFTWSFHFVSRYVFLYTILFQLELKISGGFFLHGSAENCLIHYIKSFEMLCPDLYAVKCNFVGKMHDRQSNDPSLFISLTKYISSSLIVL